MQQEKESKIQIRKSKFTESNKSTAKSKRKVDYQICQV
jgi:hypothetical protein